MSKMLQKLLAVGLALAFLLSMPGVSAIVEAVSSAVFTAEQLEQAIIAGDGEIDLGGANIAVERTLTIESTVTISNGTISRSKDVNIFDVNGNLTLENVTLKGAAATKEKSYRNSGVKVEDAGNLTINNSIITGFTASNGGGLLIENGGTAVMNSGKITGNKAYGSMCYGGGVCVIGTFIMNDGEISENVVETYGYGQEGQAYGGGVAVKKRDAHFVMNGGSICNNTAKLYDNTSMQAHGGGVYIDLQNKNTELIAGKISNNDAQMGGGIYAHNLSELHVKNIAVINNNATGFAGENSPFAAMFGFYWPNQGGGLWFCDLGTGRFYATSGGIIVNNTTDNLRGDDVVFDTVEGTKGYHLPSRLNDGTPLYWYNDGSEKSEEPIEDINEKLANTTNSNVLLKSRTSSSAEGYSLEVSDNTAVLGGGIACNGTLIMGEDKDTSLMVKKVWQDSKGEPLSEADIPVAEITVNLVNTSIKDEESHGKVVDTVTLNAGNDWHYTFKDLPSDQEFTVEEVAFEGSEDYEIEVSKPTVTAPPEGEGETADKTITVTNKQVAKTGDLRIVKTVKGRDGDKKKYFSFDIVITDAEGNPIPDGVYGGCEIKGGEYTADIPHGNALTITGLPDGAKYTITEHAYDGYRTTVSGEVTSEKTGTIVAGETQRVEFVNTRKTGNLSVKKVVSAKEIDEEKAFNFTVKLDTPLTGTYGDMTFTDGEARFTLTHDETKTAIGLPTGIKYTVVEDGGADGYVTTYTGEVSVEGAPVGAQSADENGVTGFTGEIAEGVAKVTVKNTQSVGSLMVTKSVTGSGSPDDTFKIKVTLTGVAESGEKCEEINGQYGNMIFKDGVAEFNIKHSQSISADNLPIGLDYKVEEILDEGSDYSDTYTNQKGKIAKDTTAEVKVINDRPYGSLSISKAITGADYKDYKDHTFEFVVKGPAGSKKPIESHSLFKGTGSAKFENLIPGEYTIEEVSDSALLTDYDWNGVTFSGEGIEIVDEHTIKVTVKADENTATEVVATNSYTSKLGKLTITKEVKGLDDVTDANIIHQKYTFDIIRNADNKVVETVTLTDGESKTVEDLTPGTYTVKEVDGDIKGYTKTVTVSGDGEVTVEANKTAEVTVTNAYTQILGSLKIVKTAKYSDGAPVPERTFKFTVTGPSYPQSTYPEGYKVTVTVDEKGHGESEVLDNLIPGEYTVTEDAEDAKMDGYELAPAGFSKTVTVDYTSETKPVEVEAVNTYTQILGNLKIVKEAKDTEGKPVGVAHTFAFTVTGPSCPDGHEVTVTVDENGRGESDVLDNLIPGEYTVAEVPESAKLDGYCDPQVEYVSSATVNVEADKTATASVTVINTYEKQYGGMKISKRVEIDNPSELDNYEYNKPFIIHIYRNEGGFEALREITEGQTIILDNLEPGVYTVEEIEGDLLEQKYEDGSVVQWSHKVTGESTQIVVEPATTAEGYVEVNLTNIYSPIVEWGELELTKDIVLNNTNPEDYASILAEKNFRFIIDGPLGYQKVVTLSYNEPSVTLKYLVPGIYTVTEEQSPKIDGYEWVEVGSLTVEVKAMQQAPAVQDIPAEVPAVVSIPIPKAPEMIAADMIANPAMNAPEGFGMNVFGEVPEDQPELFPEEIPEMFVTDMPAPFAPLDDNTVGDPVPADQVVTNTEPARLTVTNTYNKLGSLVLTKNVTGNYTGAYGKTYSFTVTGPSCPAPGREVTVTVDENGHGETQLDNLKPGTYTVTEKDKENLEQKGFVFNVTGEGTAAVEYGETAGITVTNDYKELGKLTVTKSVKGLPEDLLGTEEFNFEVRNEAGEAVAEFTLKNGENYTVEGLEPGTYTVTEKDAKVEGYDVTVTGEGTAEVKYDATALVTVTNTYEELGKLTVTKKVEGLDGVTDENILNHEYSFEVRNEKGETVDAFTLKDGKSYTVENLKPGTYEIIETNNELDGYKLDVKTDGSAEVEYGKTANVTVTNSYKELGKLTVTKSVAGDSEEAKSKLYTFKIEGPDGFVRYVTVTGNSSVTVDKLEPGTYTVTEVTETYTDENGEEVSVNLNIDGYAWEVTGQGQEVVIDLDDADKAKGEVTVTNTYTRELGSLTITKSVEGNSDEAEDKVYTFNVTGPDGYSASVTVTGSGSTTLTDLVPGTYTVTEDDAEIEGFELEVTGGGTVEVVANETAGITVTNTYTKEVGSLTITKTVAGDSEEAEGKTYTFDVSGPDGYAETVTITGSGSATLEDLVPGVYTVTERNSEIDGYELTVTGGGTVSAVVVKDETATAAFTNTYTKEVGSLTITKTVAGDSEEAEGKTYTFDVSGPDGYAETVTITGSGSATLEDLVPGVYTVTERNSEIDGYELTVTGGGTVSAVVVKDETATAAFTNTYRELRSISVTKEWYVDGNRAFAPAGASITVNLLANGADTGKSLVISESTGWAGTFEELYVNDENGETIAYSISEQSYLGWQSSVTGSADSGFVVINSTTTPPDTPDIPNIPDNPYYPTIPEYPTPEEPYIPPVDIPEPEVPLTDIPDEPEVPLTDIVDDEVPLFDKVPETGDESNTALWISIAVCSALGIAILAAALIRDSKKTRKED